MRTDHGGSGRRKNFQISFDPDCTECTDSDCIRDLGACNVTKMEPKDIKGTIKVLEYDGYDEATIDVTIEGIAEKLTLDINIINNCTCENDAEKISKYCDDERRECGVCQCKEPK